MAHYNRDKKKNFKPWWIELRNLNLPRGKENKDITVWISMLNRILVTRYYDDLKEFSDENRKDFESFKIWEKQDNKESIDRNYFNGIIDEVENRLKEFGMNDLTI